VRFLGIDYGRKRIGLALSDATGLLARPWKTVAARPAVKLAAADIAREIEALRQEPEGLGGIVIGLPLRLSGEANDQTATVQGLASELRQRTAVPVTLQDERLSSREAESLLARREKDWRKRKPLLDAMSAAVVLQDFLDSRTGVLPRSDEDDGRSAHPHGDSQ
jgi:putative holliday junction resolvase